VGTIFGFRSDIRGLVARGRVPVSSGGAAGPWFPGLSRVGACSCLVMAAVVAGGGRGARAPFLDQGGSATLRRARHCSQRPLALVGPPAAAGRASSDAGYRPERGFFNSAQRRMAMSRLLRLLVS
jgi:hypothetical protein